MRGISRRVVLILVATGLAAGTAVEAQPSDVRSQLISSNPTGADVAIYRLDSRRTISFDEIELWDKIPPSEHPLRFFYNGDVDYRVIFLQEGFAKLRPGVDVPAELVAAEARAKRSQVGLWAPPPAPVPKPSPQPEVATPTSPDPPPTPERKPSWWTLAWSWLSGERGKGILVQIVRSIVVLISFFGAYEFVGILIRWRRRFRVDVIFFGQISVGKTWLWLRTLHPGVSSSTLTSQLPSKMSSKKKLHRMPMGDYTMRPVFTDMPGSRPGAQLTQLVDRRRLWWLQNAIFPQKRVWVISLASTIDNGVTRSHPFEERVRKEHLDRQYGSLVLYEAALREPKTHKPAMVIICITKADLFADDEGDLKAGRRAHSEVLDVFSDSIRRLESVCKEEHVPVTTITTSALFGWGCQNFTDALRDAFYPPAAAAA